MAKDTKKRGVLLASFLTGASEQQIMHCVSTIASLPSLASNNIFLFENTEDPSRHLLTYNLYLDQKKQFVSDLTLQKIILATVFTSYIMSLDALSMSCGT